MVNVTSFVGCGCLRKNEDITEVDENNSLNKKKLKQFSKEEEKTISEKESHLIAVPTHSYSENIKMPVTGYFDGKIDIKDYIQKVDIDQLENYKKIKFIGKGSYSNVIK